MYSSHNPSRQKIFPPFSDEVARALVTSWGTKPVMSEGRIPYLTPLPKDLRFLQRQDKVRPKESSQVKNNKFTSRFYLKEKLWKNPFQRTRKGMFFYHGHRQVPRRESHVLRLLTRLSPCSLSQTMARPIWLHRKTLSPLSSKAIHTSYYESPVVCRCSKENTFFSAAQMPQLPSP